jgi:hypothetical protein
VILLFSPVFMPACSFRKRTDSSPPLSPGLGMTPLKCSGRRRCIRRNRCRSCGRQWRVGGGCGPGVRRRRGGRGLGRRCAFGRGRRDECRMGERRRSLRRTGWGKGGGQRELPRWDCGRRMGGRGFFDRCGPKGNQERGSAVEGDRRRNDPPQDGVEHGAPLRVRSLHRHRRNYTRPQDERVRTNGVVPPRK